MSDEQKTGFWAIVEIMGHKRYAGHVSEQVVGGASFVRVDVPEHGECQAFTKLLAHPEDLLLAQARLEGD